MIATYESNCKWKYSLVCVETATFAPARSTILRIETTFQQQTGVDKYSSTDGKNRAKTSQASRSVIPKLQNTGKNSATQQLMKTYNAFPFSTHSRHLAVDRHQRKTVTSSLDQCVYCATKKAFLGSFLLRSIAVNRSP